MDKRLTCIIMNWGHAIVYVFIIVVALLFVK